MLNYDYHFFHAHKWKPAQMKRGGGREEKEKKVRAERPGEKKEKSNNISTDFKLCSPKKKITQNHRQLSRGEEAQRHFDCQQLQRARFFRRKVGKLILNLNAFIQLPDLLAVDC
jgi:hypothetical protein